MSATTMTERQLHALAAKAAGLRVRWEEVHFCFWIEAGQGLTVEPWSPLTDDGDALRLAHATRIVVDFLQQCVSHWRLPARPCIYGHFDMALVRRMIVEVAAEVAQLPPLPEPKPIPMGKLHDLSRLVDMVRADLDAGKAAP